MAKYRVSAKKAKAGVSNTAFRLGSHGDEGFVEGRVGGVVELSDEQLERLERSPFEFTAVEEPEAPRQTPDTQEPQRPHDTQEPQPPTGEQQSAPVASERVPI